MNNLISDGMRLQLKRHNKGIKMTAESLRAHLLPDLVNIVGQYLWINDKPLPASLIDVISTSEISVKSPCKNFQLDVSLGYPRCNHPCCETTQQTIFKVHVFLGWMNTNFPAEYLWGIVCPDNADYELKFVSEVITDMIFGARGQAPPSPNTWDHRARCAKIVNDMIADIRIQIIAKARRGDWRI